MLNQVRNLNVRHPPPQSYNHLSIPSARSGDDGRRTVLPHTMDAKAKTRDTTVNNQCLYSCFNGVEEIGTSSSISTVLRLVSNWLRQQRPDPVGLYSSVPVCPCSQPFYSLEMRIQPLKTTSGECIWTTSKLPLVPKGGLQR